MTLFTFDNEYLQRLSSGDALTEHHFSTYFSDLLMLKLRARLRSRQLVEDVRQETLLRVLEIVRRGGVQFPERFGAFVNSVCNNVMRELLRGESRHDQMDEDGRDPADTSIDMDGDLITAQRKRQVLEILAELSTKDRDLLRAVFLEERDRGELCRRMGVNEEYLRVLLHRAKGRFRDTLQKRSSADSLGR